MEDSLLWRGNYCVFSKYYKCVLSVHFSETYHSCEMRKYTFMVFREYLIIFLFVVEDQANKFIKNAVFFFSNLTSAPPMHRCLEVEGKEVGDARLASYYVYISNLKKKKKKTRHSHIYHKK